LDIIFLKMISRPHEESHDWIRQTSRGFEITVSEFFIKHKVQTEF
jgi:hypothetical protein